MHKTIAFRDNKNIQKAHHLLIFKNLSGTQLKKKKNFIWDKNFLPVKREVFRAYVNHSIPDIKPIVKFTISYARAVNA